MQLYLILLLFIFICIFSSCFSILIFPSSIRCLKVAVFYSLKKLQRRSTFVAQQMLSDVWVVDLSL